MAAALSAGSAARRRRRRSPPRTVPSRAHHAQFRAGGGTGMAASVSQALLGDAEDREAAYLIESGDRGVDRGSPPKARCPGHARPPRPARRAARPGRRTTRPAARAGRRLSLRRSSKARPSPPVEVVEHLGHPGIGTGREHVAGHTDPQHHRGHVVGDQVVEFLRAMVARSARGRSRPVFGRAVAFAPRRSLPAARVAAGSKQ